MGNNASGTGGFEFVNSQLRGSHSLESIRRSVDILKIEVDDMLVKGDNSYMKDILTIIHEYLNFLDTLDYTLYHRSQLIMIKELYRDLKLLKRQLNIDELVSLEAENKVTETNDSSIINKPSFNTLDIRIVFNYIFEFLETNNKSIDTNKTVLEQILTDYIQQVAEEKDGEDEITKLVQLARNLSTQLKHLSIFTSPASAAKKTKLLWELNEFISVLERGTVKNDELLYIQQNIHETITELKDMSIRMTPFCQELIAKLPVKQNQDNSDNINKSNYANFGEIQEILKRTELIDVKAKKPIPSPRNHDEVLINRLPEHWSKLVSLSEKENLSEDDRHDLIGIGKDVLEAGVLFEDIIVSLMEKFNQH